MLDLALNVGKGPILLKEVARRQEIPLRYLEQLIAPLKASELVRSTRGAKGGYVLARRPSEITVGEIIAALEGSIAPVDCVVRPKSCKRSVNCVARDVWVDMDKAIHGVIDALTLEELVRRHHEKQPEAFEYNI